jgi:micrococcal nuclease
LASAPLAAAPANTSLYRVQRVVDGDTLVLSNGEKVRLIGVDTPEMHHSAKMDRDLRRTHRDRATMENLGKRAKTFVDGLVRGQLVRLAFDQANAAHGHKDRYGRTLAYVYFTPGRAPPGDLADLEPYRAGFLNAVIVAAGYGHAYTSYPFAFDDRFRGYERDARAHARGLWRADPADPNDAMWVEPEAPKKRRRRVPVGPS